MQMVRQVQDGQPLLSVARQIASTSAPSPRFFSADPASKREKRRRQSFPSRRAFLQGRRERRIAGSAVDEFCSGPKRDHHAPGRIANRVLAFGAHLERAVRFRRAIDPADGGRQKDPLRRLDNRGLSELVHRLPISPAAAAPLEQPLAIPFGIGPGPDQLRKALWRKYARDFRRLPSGRGRRQRRFGDRRSWSRRRLLSDDGRSRGRARRRRWSRRRRSVLSCIRRRIRSGSRRRRRRGSGRRRGLLRRWGGSRRGRRYLGWRRSGRRRRRNRRGSDGRWLRRNRGSDIHLVAGCPEDGSDHDEGDAPEHTP